MKTTVEISDPLLREAREMAAREGTTLRALVEKGLRAVVESRTPAAPYRFDMPTAGEGGLTPEFAAKGWEKIRDAAYDDGDP